MMCEVLEISQATYYRISKRASKDDYDASLIFNVFNESLQTYGYRRIKQALLETRSQIIWYLKGMPKSKEIKNRDLVAPTKNPDFKNVHF